MADEVAKEEEEELEALLEYMSDVERDPSSQRTQGWPIRTGDEMGMDGTGNTGTKFSMTRQDQLLSDTPYGSDDEEYDHIFLDMIREESRTSSPQGPSGYAGTDHEMMDMS